MTVCHPPPDQLVQCGGRALGQRCSSSTPGEIDCACRVCFGCEQAGLVTPCSCRGSLQHVHIGCLQQWQRMLWHSGQCSRALQCDICRQPYQQQYAVFPLHQHVPLLARAKQLALQLYHRPELAFRAWRYCIMFGGIAAGTHKGMSGFKAGVSAGFKSAKPLASFTFKLMPQLSILAAVLPHLQPILRSMLRCSFAVMAAEVVLAGAAGLCCGGLLGFCLGTVGVVRLTADCSCHAASIAAMLAARLTKSSSKVASQQMLLSLMKLRSPR
eukprot:GHUV01005367.1.p1 GENE.GHUV01005367.1~~GHUV01005367.1.p1  ORF type:complete len:270 (+),score=58.77 GHUV01005367.1:143-952(+)